MKQKTVFNFMIVEDEQRIHEHLIKKITTLDPRFQLCNAAFNGKQALELLAEKQPDVVFTDIRMPVLDGLQLAEELYYHYPEIITVIISGYDDFAYAKTAISFDVIDYLLKPVNDKELSFTLAKIANKLLQQTEQLTEDLHTYTNNMAQKDLATSVASYLREHYRQNISIGTLAEKFHVNPTYMTRMFKQYVGKTPTRFIVDLRINHAKKLILEIDNVELKEIAYQVGYLDQGYFSRIFKKTTGLSPSEFKQQEENSNLE